MKEGNGSVNDFLDEDDNSNDEDIDFDVVEVGNNGEQSPNNGFINLDLAELIPCVADCFRCKRDGLEDGGNKDIFVFDAGNTEHHASAHLRMKRHRQIPAWFELCSLAQFLLCKRWSFFNEGNFGLCHGVVNKQLCLDN